MNSVAQMMILPIIHNLVSHNNIVSSLGSSDVAYASAQPKGKVVSSQTLHIKKLVVLRRVELLQYVEGEVKLSSTLILIRQNQIILSCLLVTLSSTIIPEVVNLTTSTEVWKALLMLLLSNSMTQLLFLRWQFLNIKKGTMTLVMKNGFTSAH